MPCAHFTVPPDVQRRALDAVGRQYSSAHTAPTISTIESTVPTSQVNLLDWHVVMAARRHQAGDPRHGPALRRRRQADCPTTWAMSRAASDARGRGCPWSARLPMVA
jgi:hypothetical protein